MQPDATSRPSAPPEGGTAVPAATDAAVAPAALGLEQPVDALLAEPLHEELRRTLEQVSRALHRLPREGAPDGGGALEAVVRQLRQAGGALRLAGLGRAALLPQAAAEALRRAPAQALLSPQVLEAVERGGAALGAYLARWRAGRPLSSLVLFPAWRALAELAGDAQAHPVALWPVPWRWVELPEPGPGPALQPDAATRAVAEPLTLAFLREPRGPAAARLADLFTALARGAAQPELATLWRLAAAVFEAQAHGLLDEAQAKRLAARLLAQLRRGPQVQDGAAVERLAHELLYTCAQAGTVAHAGATPRLAAVREAWGLQVHPAIDVAHALPPAPAAAALAQALRDVAQAQALWEAAVDDAPAPGLEAAFAQLAQSLREVLGPLLPGGAGRVDQLGAALAQAVASARPGAPVLAQEVAGALLALQLLLEEQEFDALQSRLEDLAQRVAQADAGAVQGPMPTAPWLEALAQRAGQRQAVQALAEAMRVQLREAAQQLELAAPARDAAALETVGQRLQQLRRAASAAALPPPVVQALQSLAQGLARVGAANGARQLRRLESAFERLGQGLPPGELPAPSAEDAFADTADADGQRPAGGDAPRPAPDRPPPAPLHEQSELPALTEPPSVLPDDAEDWAEVLPALAEPAEPVPLREALTPPAERVALATLLRQPDRPAVVPAPAANDALAVDVIDADAAFGLAAAEPVEAPPRFRPSLLEPEPPAPVPAGLPVLDELPASAAELDERAELAELAELAAEGAPAAAPGEWAWPDDEPADADLLERFAAEVSAQVAAGQQALADWEAAPQETASLAALCQAFAGLRDGARLLGLAGYAQAAEAGAALFDARLAADAAAPQADAALHGFAAGALAHLARWAEALAEGRGDEFGPGPVQQLAQSLREAAAEPTPPPAAPAVPVEPIAPVPPVAPEASGTPAESAPARDEDEADAGLAFELSFDLPSPPAAAEPAEAPAQDDGLAFDLSFDLPPAPAAERDGAALADDAADPVEPVPAGDVLEEDFGAWFQEPPAPAPRAAPVPEDAAGEDFELQFGEDEAAEPAPEPEPEPVLPAAEPLELLAPPDAEDAEDAVAVGPLRVPSSLFGVYVEEARALLARLQARLAQWQPPQPLERECVVVVHALAGMAATVGDDGSSVLARSLEQVLAPCRQPGRGTDDTRASALDAVQALAAMLAQFEAGTLPAPAEPALLARLQSMASMPMPAAPPADGASDADGGAAPAPSLDAEAGAEPQDDPRALEAELFPVFEEEAQELLPQLAQDLARWSGGDAAAAAACLRTLHTLKGGARLAGAMRLGAQAHRLEDDIEALAARSQPPVPAEHAALQARADALGSALDALCAGFQAAMPPAEPGGDSAAPSTGAAEAAGTAPWPDAGAVAGPGSEAVPGAGEEAAAMPAHGSAGVPATVRVRAPVLDRLVAHAGEVGVSRERLASQVQQLTATLAVLGDNVQRLRSQVREVEQQAEAPPAEEFPAVAGSGARLQALARQMADSLDDLAAVQRGLQHGIRSAEDELAAQARLARELQEELLRTRLVAFDSVAERLQRVTRQAAQEASRQVRLEIEGGAVELDRGVLERMTPAFEHLLRNAVAHGIEAPAERFMAGKPSQGVVRLCVAQEGASVVVSCEDDGRGLDLSRIHRRAVERGLLPLEAQPDAATLQRLVFAPGFSTAERLSPLAGRGVGLDVVRAEVESLGGRIELQSRPGQGCRFTLGLPLTTAVTPLLLLRSGEDLFGVPAALVESVLRLPAAQAQAAAHSGRLGDACDAPAFHTLEALLQRPALPLGPAMTVLLLRGAPQRVALQVQEVMGPQEAVLQPLGPQLASLPGITGMGLLPSGAPLPVISPAALALRRPVQAEPADPREAAAPGDAAGAAVAASAPLVLVVEDSPTVRRVTQRLLERQGYRVALAQDGQQALQRLAQEIPSLVLTDIEMPGMDGLDLVRRLRAEPHWQSLPVVVISSRVAPGHREQAAALGVVHYLGKPYAEEELLSLVARYSAV